MLFWYSKARRLPSLLIAFPLLEKPDGPAQPWALPPDAIWKLWHQLSSSLPTQTWENSRGLPLPLALFSSIAKIPDLLLATLQHLLGHLKEATWNQRDCAGVKAHAYHVASFSFILAPRGSPEQLRLRDLEGPKHLKSPS